MAADRTLCLALVHKWLCLTQGLKKGCHSRVRGRWRLSAIDLIWLQWDSVISTALFGHFYWPGKTWRRRHYTDKLLLGIWFSFITYNNKLISASPSPCYLACFCCLMAAWQHLTLLHQKRWFPTIQCLKARMHYTRGNFLFFFFFRCLSSASLKFLMQKFQVNWLKCLWKMNPQNWKWSCAEIKRKRRKKKTWPWGRETEDLLQ